MATAVEEHNVLLLAQVLRAEERPDSSPQSFETLLQDQDHVMQGASQTVTNLALAQGWSFARVTADPASAGLASLESVQEQDKDAAVRAKSQEPAPEPAIAKTSGSEVTRIESPAQESPTTKAAAETSSSNDTRTLVSVKDEGSESDDEDVDILAAIRRRQSRSVQPARPADHQASPFPSGAPTANTPVNSAGSRQKAIPSHNSVHDVTKSTAQSRTPICAARSSFLAKYSYAGTKRQGQSDEKGEYQEPKHSCKRPSPEVIDLTDVPDEPSLPTASSHREGKRRKLDKHGREKRSKAERADSQVHEDARKKSASRSLLGRKDREDTRSPASHKFKESRRKHRRERHKERERDRLQKSAQPTGNQLLSGAQPTPRQVPRQQALQRWLTTRQANGQQNTQEDRPQLRQELSHGTGSVEHQLPQLPQQPRQQNLNGNRPNATQSRGQGASQNMRPDLQLEPRPQPLPGRTQGNEKGPPRNQPALANRVSGSTINAGNLSDGETINAIKYRQPTVAEKARSKIEEIKKAAQRAQEKSGLLSVSGLENDADLFQHFASKVAQKRSTELISAPPNRTERLAPNNLHRANELPYLPPPPVATGNRQVTNLAQSRNIFQVQPASQPCYTTQAGAEMQLRELQSSNFLPLPLRRSQQQQQQRALPPLARPEDDQPHIPLPHRETISAVEALGPDRTVVQYVVYRTPRFTPPCSGMTTDQELLEQVKKEKAIRCSEHLALAQANSQAAARQDRPRKGVVGKGWSMVKSTLSSSFSSPSYSSSYSSSAVAPDAASGSGTVTEPGPTSNPNSAESTAQPAAAAQPQPQPQLAPQLYSGQVTYENGEIQLFWVGEETRDLGGAVPGVAAVDMARAGGWVRVDKAGVEVYRRKRFDVWSRVYWGAFEEIRSEVNGQDVVSKCGEGQEGKDTGGEVRGKDGEEVNGEGENGDDEGMAGEKSTEERSEGGQDVERDENEDKEAGVEHSTQDSERARDGEVEQNGDDEGMGAKKTIEENREEAQPAGVDESDERAVGAERHYNGAQHEDEHEAGVVNPAETGAGTEIRNEGKAKETPAERREKEAEAEAVDSHEQPHADTTAQRIRRWQESQGLRKPKITKKQKADKAADETDSDDTEDESEDDESPSTAPQNPQPNATSQDPSPVTPVPSPSALGSNTVTIKLHEGKSIVDIVDTVPKLHGTYTTLVHANRAALSTVLQLAKPRKRHMEDNHCYKYQVEPYMTEKFEENGWGRKDCTTPACFEWDTPHWRPHNWGFLRLAVEVIESELTGPVDLGDLVVEGGGDTGDGELREAGGEAGKGTREENGVMGRKESEVVSKRAANMKTPPSPSEKESDGEVSEEG